MSAAAADCWTTIGQAAARVVEKLFREIARREHPAPERTLH